MTTHITDLPPEVLELIGAFLSNRVILNATLACRHFHRHLSSFLWKHVAASVARRNVDVDNLRVHSKWVRSLRYVDYEGQLPLDYYDISFPTLSVLELGSRSLKVSGPGPSAEEYTANWTRLIRLNPTVRDLSLTFPTDFAQVHTELFETIMASLYRPRRLQVDCTGSCEVPYSVQQSLWRVVSCFEEVEFASYDQARQGASLDVDLSRIKRLTYLPFNNDGVVDYDLKVLTACRGLTRLRWGNDFGQISVATFVGYLKHSTWPQLDDLALESVRQSDKEFAHVMGLVPPLKHLRLEGKNFGPLCFNQLQKRHFTTLRALHMELCHSLTSRMALDILLNCQHLEEFSARFISQDDLLATPQPWVCLGLRCLKCAFIGNTDELDSDELDSDDNNNNWQTFEHLSKLRYLEKIDLRWQDTPGSHSYHIVSGVLQWRLGYGLERLATLRRLRTIRFDTKAQNLGWEDVQFMLVHLTSLEKVFGGLSRHWKFEVELSMLLRVRGVFHES
ncbi:hypothetical protein BGW39_011470 [Mortierella sp. 14UC]|nr:hypothetical protein BGW39_011470 [Mortierella sp. 14UC]